MKEEGREKERWGREEEGWRNKERGGERDGGRGSE